MRNAIVMITSAAAILVAGGAWAKLPAPTPEKAAAAAEAKNKTAWTDKVAAYQLCKAQDKVAGKFRQSDKKPVETPPCADPGPYVPLPPAADAGAASGAPAPGAPTPAPAPASAQAPAPATK